MKRTMKNDFNSRTDAIINELLSNVVLASKNHYNSDCPFCNKKKHFYINRNTLFWDCKKCGENGNFNKLLAKFDRRELLNAVPVDLHKKLEKINLIELENDVNTEVPEIEMPDGYQRTTSNDYLKSRGFGELEFRKYNVGTVKNGLLKHYIIISVTEDGQNKGYLARNTWSKQQIKEHAKKTGKEILRYKNSEGVEFNKLLLGFDEITFFTKTVILVEGFFDKVAVDQALRLDYQQEIKCCCLFGKKVSKYQIDKLKRKRVENIILILDPDAVQTAKNISITLKKHFNTLVGFIGDDKDLGDKKPEEIIKIFNNLSEPETFNISYIQKILL